MFFSGMVKTLRRPTNGLDVMVTRSSPGEVPTMVVSVESSRTVPIQMKVWTFSSRLTNKTACISLPHYIRHDENLKEAITASLSIKRMANETQFSILVCMLDILENNFVLLCICIYIFIVFIDIYHYLTFLVVLFYVFGCFILTHPINNF